MIYKNGQHSRYKKTENDSQVFSDCKIINNFSFIVAIAFVFNMI